MEGSNEDCNFASAGTVKINDEFANINCKIDSIIDRLDQPLLSTKAKFKVLQAVAYFMQGKKAVGTPSILCNIMKLGKAHNIHSYSVPQTRFSPFQSSELRLVYHLP